MAGIKGKSGGTRPGAGRPSLEPTKEQRDQVMQLAAFGLRQSDICQVSGISEPTLVKHYANELATGKLRANVKVAQTLYKKAIAGDTTSAIFWLKCRAGWKDAQRLEMTGKDGGPIESVSMTKDEFAQIAARIAAEV